MKKWLLSTEAKSMIMSESGKVTNIQRYKLMEILNRKLAIGGAQSTG